MTAAELAERWRQRADAMAAGVMRPAAGWAAEMELRLCIAELADLDEPEPPAAAVCARRGAECGR